MRDHPGVSERVLTTAELNRALLARQLLLDRSALSFGVAIAQVGALSVQGTLLRVTIHLVGRDAYWRYAASIRASRREWFLRVQVRDAAVRPALAARMEAAADALRLALAETRARIYNSRNPLAPATVVVDGRVAGDWKYLDARVLVTPDAPFPHAVRDAVQAERAVLEAFHA